MLEVALAASVVVPRDQIRTLASLLVGGLSSTGWVVRLCSYIAIEPTTSPSGTVITPPLSASAGDQPASADGQQRRIDDWVTAHPNSFTREPGVEWAEREFHVFTQACLSRWAGNYLRQEGPVQPPVYDLQAEALAAGWPRRVVNHLKPTPFRLGSFVALLHSLGLELEYQDVVRNFHCGMRIGYEGPRHTRVAQSGPTEAEVSQRLQAHVDKEVTEHGRMVRLWGPVGKGATPRIPDWIPYYIASPVYDIPKKANGVPIVPAEYRFIHNLSHGKITGSSVNDFISKDEYRCLFISFDHACQELRLQGRLSSIFKTDLPSAFRVMPVHLEDVLVQGFVLDGHAYCDAFMPFGLRSAPHEYARFGKALRDVARGLALGNAAVTQNTPQLSNMQDDFWHIEPPGAVRGDPMVAARIVKASFLHLLVSVGLEPKPSKTKGPALDMVLLGLLLDSTTMEIRVPPERIADLRGILATWMGATTATKQQLQSLVGALSFACFGVRWGRGFLRRLIALFTSLPFQHSRVALDADALADIAWWIKYALSDAYTGVSLIVDLDPVTLATLVVYFFTDSSGLCCAGGWGDRWFCHVFEGDQAHWHISVKELFSAVAVCLTFGSELRGRIVVIECDNEASCEAINATRAFDPVMNSLVRELFFCTALHSFQVKAVHVPGRTNTLADALTRPALRHRAWVIRPSLHRAPVVPTLPTMQW